MGFIYVRYEYMYVKIAISSLRRKLYLFLTITYRLPKKFTYQTNIINCNLENHIFTKEFAQLLNQ